MNQGITPTRLDTLRIENFRAFNELKIDFHPELTILVSPNGGGKTAVLDAISVAWRIFVNVLEARPGAGGFIHADVRRVPLEDGSMQSTLPTAVRANGTINGEPEVLWTRTLSSDKPNAKTTYAEALALKARGQRLRKALQEFAEKRVPSPPLLPLICLYGTGRLWAPHRFSEKRRGGGRPDTSPTSGYADCLSAGSRYKFFEDWFERFSREAQEEQAIGKPSPHKPGLKLSVVRQAVNTVLKPTGWEDLRWDFAESTIVATHPVHGRLSVDNLSDGIRNIIGLVGDLAHRAARLNAHLGDQAAFSTPGVVLIDEVDMHLHTTWQQVVLSALREAFPAVQFIVTTHSPQVLTTVPKENIRIIKRSDLGVWSAEIPNFSPLAKESGDALAFVLGTQARPNLGLMDDLRLFEQLVRLGQGLSDRAAELKLRLLQAGFEFSDTEQRLLELFHRKANPNAHPLF